MDNNVVTNIESKNKATRYLSFQSLLLFISYMLISYMFKNYVHIALLIPYFAFSGFCGMFLLMPSKFNKGRNHLQSIFILMRGDKGIYKPYIHREEKEEEEHE